MREMAALPIEDAGTVPLSGGKRACPASATVPDDEMATTTTEEAAARRPPATANLFVASPPLPPPFRSCYTHQIT
jgi:hypothetical protein